MKSARKGPATFFPAAPPAEASEAPGTVKKAAGKTDVMMICGVSSALRRRFRIAAYTQDTTMRAVVIEAIEAYIKAFESRNQGT